MIAEGIYTGKVWHRRLLPFEHLFHYRMLMIAVDLNNLADVFTSKMLLTYNQAGILALRDRDHFPESAHSLRDNIVAMLPAAIAAKPYKILLISQLAHFGFAFNPISFFVISSAENDQILGLILEVHNTPWGERHYYQLFDIQHQQDVVHAKFDKVLHVSPFLSMDFSYVFSLRKSASGLSIKMENWHDEVQHFNAGIVLDHHPLERRHIILQLLRHPFSPIKTVAAIYWQALKLWLKGAKFFPHPKMKQP